MTAERADGSTTNADDAAVIERSWRDPNAFAVIFDRYATTVYRFLARRVGEQLADDLTGQTMLLAFDQRKRFDTARRDCLPWLYGIANNLVRRHRRAEARQYRALAREGAAPAAENPAETVSEQVSASAATRLLAPELAKLGRKERDILLLIAWEHMSYEEVAQALGVPLGTVRSRLHRARAKLRAALGETNPLHPEEHIDD